MYSPDGKCNHELPELPTDIYGGAIFFIHRNLYFCGGRGSKPNENLCYSLNQKKSKWILENEYTLNQPRHMAASSVSKDGVIFYR